MQTGMYALWRLEGMVLLAVAAGVAMQGQSPSKQPPDPALASGAVSSPIQRG
jgi:hypothetical protein